MSDKPFSITPAAEDIITIVVADSTITTVLNNMTLAVTADELNKLSGVPADLTSTEIGYLDGVTSSIQDQINARVKTINTQTAETQATELIRQNWKTAGNAPFQIHTQSYPNPYAPGTFNHGTFIGYNVGRHSSMSSTAGKPSLIMGMEDAYFASPSEDNSLGMEWYIEYFSPDGTSVQMLRPFYTRIGCTNNTTNWANTWFNIGTDSLGQFSVLSGITNLLTVSKTAASISVPLTLSGILTLQTEGMLMPNSKYIFMKKVDGSVAATFSLGNDNHVYIGDIFGETAMPVHLRSGGLNALNLNPDGTIDAYSTINMTTANISGFMTAATVYATNNYFLGNNKYFQIINNIGSPISILTLDASNDLYFGDIFNQTTRSVFLRAGGVSALTLSPNGAVTTYGTLVCGGELLFPNNHWLQTMKADTTPVPVIGIDSLNNLSIGDVFNHITTDVALMAGGKQNILLSPAGDVKFYGYTDHAVGATVASAATITPTGPIFHVSGNAVISTINLPYTGFTGSITLIPDGAFSTNTAGNIKLGTPTQINRALIMTCDGTYWYPSY